MSDAHTFAVCMLGGPDNHDVGLSCTASTEQQSTAQQSTAQHSTAQHSIVWHSTARQTCSAALAAVGRSRGLGLSPAQSLHIHITVKQAGNHPLHCLHPFPLVQLILCLAQTKPTAHITADRRGQRWLDRAGIVDLWGKRASAQSLALACSLLTLLFLATILNTCLWQVLILTTPGGNPLNQLHQCCASNR